MESPQLHRPAVVTVSSVLLAAAAVLLVIFTVLSAWQYYEYVHAYEDAVADGAIESESFEGVGGLLNYGFTVVQIAAAGVLMGLARSNLRGLRSTRTTTWWMGGVMLCCPAVDAGGFIAGDSAPHDPVQQRLQHILPGWWEPADLVVVLLLVSTLLLALVLLALPPANKFFRESALAGSPSMR